jgi:hypothetical protein
MKALSRNNVTATILGREGLLTVMTEIITKLSTLAFGPKLKVASEVLAALTKSSEIFCSFTVLEKIAFIVYESSTELLFQRHNCMLQQLLQYPKVLAFL